MLLASILFIVLSNASTNRKDLSVSFTRSLLTVLLVALLLSLDSNNYVVLKNGISLLGGLFVNSSLTITFHTFILGISFIVLHMTAFYPKHYMNNKFIYKVENNLLYNLRLFDKEKDQYTILEYPLIILFTIIGTMFLISSNDIISVFLSIELQSYGLYLLCSLYRNSEASTNAGLIYFLLGGLSSCFILLGLAILYTNSGISNLDGYFILVNLLDINHFINNIIHWYDNDYFNYSLILLSLGFLFKISAAPFHFWSPDVYDAIPTVVTSFVANIAKISLLIFLTQVVHQTSNINVSGLTWTNCLLISSLLSLLVGTILGLNQSRIKKLLAYSTISHLGFMLLAISINSVESMQAFFFYLIQYSISNINAFMIIIAIGYTIYISKDDKVSSEQDDKISSEQDNSPLQYIAQLRGYYFINPMLTISLAIVMYSFVGIPPLIGFFGKQMVLISALDKGYIFLSIIAILTSVISAVYYLNIIKEMFFEKSENVVIKNDSYITILSSTLSVFISILTLIILLFILSPEILLSITNILVICMFT